jgi:hypothetical protein
MEYCMLVPQTWFLQPCPHLAPVQYFIFYNVGCFQLPPTRVWNFTMKSVTDDIRVCSHDLKEEISHSRCEPDALSGPIHQDHCPKNVKLGGEPTPTPLCCTFSFEPADVSASISLDEPVVPESTTTERALLVTQLEPRSHLSAGKRSQYDTKQCNQETQHMTSEHDSNLSLDVDTKRKRRR